MHGGSGNPTDQPSGAPPLRAQQSEEKSFFIGRIALSDTSSSAAPAPAPTMTQPPPPPPPPPTPTPPQSSSNNQHVPPPPSRTSQFSVPISHVPPPPPVTVNTHVPPPPPPPPPPQTTSSSSTQPTPTNLPVSTTSTSQLPPPPPPQTQPPPPPPPPPPQQSQQQTARGSAPAVSVVVTSANVNAALQNDLKRSQARLKRAHVRLHYKQREIDDIKNQIEEHRLIAEHYAVKHAGKRIVTDVYRNREVLGEDADLRRVLDDVNTLLTEHEIRNWDSDESVSQLRTEMKKAKDFEPYINKEVKQFAEQEVATLKKKIEELRAEIQRVDVSTAKILQEQHEHIDSYSSIKNQLEEQEAKNAHLRAELDKLSQQQQV